jgi:hypothetical protein
MALRIPRRRQRQSGSMTLLVGLLLLIGAGILTFSATRTSVIEQRIAGNEHRAMEAQQSAEAGIDFAAAWLARNSWSTGVDEPTPPPIQTANGDRYDTTLAFEEHGSGICVTAETQSASDPNVAASHTECFVQKGLFNPSGATTMPPPLVLAGCMKSPSEPTKIFISGPDSVAIESGTAASDTCLPSGTIEISLWRDTNRDGNLEASEIGASASFNRATFSGCPGDHCAWNSQFDLGYEDAKRLATEAKHVYTNNIPCGAAAASGIYVVDHSGGIGAADIQGHCAGQEGIDDATIGTPSQPILLIVPQDSGCPAFGAGISIHGIVYYESATACATQGWGGAKVYGSVIWEGSVDQPQADSQFIEAEYGVGSKLNAAFKTILDSTRTPGTWRDWE